MRRTLATTCVVASVAFLAITCTGRTAEATEVGYNRKFGLGFMIGNPTGLVGKYWLSTINALDFGVGFYGYGWGFRGCDAQGRCWGGGYGHLTLNVDYLWQSNLVKSTAQLDWHVGAGGRVDFFGDQYSSAFAVGVRGPIGLDLMFSNPSFLELFFEIAPVLYFAPIPVAGLGFEGGLGVRLYF
jgi:hypothetical protein